MQTVMTLLRTGGDYVISESPDIRLMRWLMVGTTVFDAFSAAVWPLFGALIIDRWDRQHATETPDRDRASPTPGG